MPPPGFGRGFGGWRGGGRGRWGHGPGLGPLGVIGAVAAGAVVAAAVAPPRRRYPPPRAGYIYVVHSAGESPRAVRAEEVPFIIRRVQITAHRQGSGGEILYEVQVTINDGYTYSVLRRYSQFDQLRVRVAPIVRVVTAPFPPKFGVRASTVGLQPADIEDRKVMLRAWLQSLCTAASTGYPALRVPIYDFLETALNYPPDPIAVPNTAAATTADIPYATATPYTETFAEASVAQPPFSEVPQAAKLDPIISDGWAVPVESREASDITFAMTGPDAYGRLEAGKVAEVLRSNTGALPEDLRAIWELSDIDKDGMLDRDEFTLAWYLSKEAAAGRKPPTSLPANLVPASKKALAPRSAANPF